MTINTSVEWCDHTINFWWGCEKVSPGCANCYAETFAKRVGDDIWGEGKPRRWIKSAVATARKLNAKAQQEGVRYKVFCQSMSDFFEEDQGQRIIDHRRRCLYTINGDELFTEAEYPECREATLTDLRQQAFEVIDECQHLDWLLLTKRPENIREIWPPIVKEDCKILAFDDEAAKAYRVARGVFTDCTMSIGNAKRDNVWLLTSVENQEQADKRIPELLRCRYLSPVLGLSMEPLLGPVDLSRINLGRARMDVLSGCGVITKGIGPQSLPNAFCRALDWIITGGESGHHARPMHPDWVRSLRDQCQSAGVPFLFKQWGEWVNLNQSPTCKIKREEGHNPGFCPISVSGKPTQTPCANKSKGDVTVYKFGKKAAGRLLDGQVWSQFPEVVR